MDSWLVQKVLRVARLLLGRTPPSSMLDVHLYGCSWGLSWLFPFSLHLYVTARPATKAPVTSLYLRGRRCTAAPNGQKPPTPHVPQPLLRLVSGLRASRANGADPVRTRDGKD